jgi:hypothetical protein
MKFSELGVGVWFKTPKDGDDKIRYMKISPPVEDKYGNVFVAMNNCGFMLDSQDLTPDSEVILLEEEF